MKIAMIGGTGLIGSQAALELIERGHQVKTISLPPIPTGSHLPSQMEITLGNYMDMSDDDLRTFFQGCEGFVFAAGVDERIEGPAPIYDFFKKYNIDSLERLLGLAKECGIQHAVVCGSYFTYFVNSRPEVDLVGPHQYIRSRVDQQKLALSYADEHFDVAVLELPYIYGTQPGRKPVWVFLAEMLLATPEATYYPRGGTTMVTVKQVGQAIAGALERNRGGHAYPIGYYNMTWVEMLTICQQALGLDKPIMTIPDDAYLTSSEQLMQQRRAEGFDPGLDMVKFADLQLSNMFIDKELGCVPLGVEEDDIVAAITDSMQLSQQIIAGQVQDTIDMKAE